MGEKTWLAKNQVHRLDLSFESETMGIIQRKQQKNSNGTEKLSRVI